MPVFDQESKNVRMMPSERGSEEKERKRSVALGRDCRSVREHGARVR